MQYKKNIAILSLIRDRSKKSRKTGQSPTLPDILVNINHKLKIPDFSLYLFVYFFCNIFMIVEPAHTTSKERMALEFVFV